ncbi:MAG: M48 family metallopeptidase, partial [Candidatus Omnitrophica bacterium]|nr:M48 family metallopeptidase [Candidatus Omnitrophota bacterium]
INYFFRSFLELLNAFSIKPELPQDFQGFYDPDKYRRSQEYLRQNTYFKIVHDSFFTLIILVFIISGLFNFIDQIIRAEITVELLRGLIFAGIIFFIFQILEIPFSIYHTFFLEQRFGFNRTTPKTFILDLLKTWLLTLIIAGFALSAVFWFFMKAGGLAWVWCWLFVTAFQILLMFVAPVIIMPLFNKFTPLEEGELRTAIEDYARAEDFKLAGIFTMDGSKRSTKSNAFFTGFGKSRRIVFFDTLIANHSLSELVSILAHEMGHYKRKHILKYIAISIFTNGMMFFILSLFINNPLLFEAFKMKELSVYASLLFFSFLYTPINLILSIGLTSLSRRHEYQADKYAVLTYKHPDSFIQALKKLTVDNLSNLTPHPLKVFIDYTHPPVLKRIQAIKAIQL